MILSYYLLAKDINESLNYKKALVDTARIQSVEDRHLSKLNTLLD